MFMRFRSRYFSLPDVDARALFMKAREKNFRKKSRLQNDDNLRNSSENKFITR